MNAVPSVDDGTLAALVHGLADAVVVCEKDSAGAVTGTAAGVRDETERWAEERASRADGSTDS